MREIISKAVSSGLDFTRRGALKSFLAKIDVEQDTYDMVYTTIKNMSFEKDFCKIPYNNRIVFLPQCLRNINECPAEMTKEGYRCKKCGKCSIGEIFTLAEELGYKGIYIVPGSSLVRNIVERDRPKAVVGVACYLELAETMEHVALLDTIPQGIPLLKDGCVDTVADMDKVKKIMKMYRK